MNSILRTTSKIPQPVFSSPTSTASIDDTTADVSICENGERQFQQACSLYDNLDTQLTRCEEAEELFKAAAEQGHVGAMARLVVIYTDRMNTYKNRALASLVTSNSNAQLILDQIPVHLQPEHDNGRANGINELVTTCTAYLHNQKIVTKLPNEKWFSIIEESLSTPDRRNLAKTCKTFAFIEGSAYSPDVTLNLSKLNKNDEADFRHYLQSLSALNFKVTIRGLFGPVPYYGCGHKGPDESEKEQFIKNAKWFRIFCEEISENKKISAINLDLGGTVAGDAEMPYVAKLTNLHSLNLGGATITDAGLSKLARLTEIRFLNLSGSEVTDAGLLYVSQFTHMHTLELVGTPVRGAQLAALAKLTNLHSLDLRGTPIKYAGLLQLVTLTQLQSLSLYETSVADDWLPQLAKLTNLHTLNVGYSQVSKKLSSLATLPDLRILCLNCTKVTDEGLSDVALLTHLQSLDLSGCRAITDAGLPSLTPLTHLHILDLRATKITDAGLPGLALLRHLCTLKLNYELVQGAGSQYLKEQLPALDIAAG